MFDTPLLYCGLSGSKLERAFLALLRRLSFIGLALSQGAGCGQTLQLDRRCQTALNCAVGLF